MCADRAADSGSYFTMEQACAQLAPDSIETGASRMQVLAERRYLTDK